MSALNPEKTDIPAEAPPAYPGGQFYAPQGGQTYPPQGGQTYPLQVNVPQVQGAPSPPNYNPQYGAPQSGEPQPGILYPAAPQNTLIVRQTQVQPSDYLGLAIFVTICCCLPFGIVAIVKSSEVRNRHQAGDFAGAQQASLSAKNWSIAGLVTGITTAVCGTIIRILYVFIFPAAAATSY